MLRPTFSLARLFPAVFGLVLIAGVLIAGAALAQADPERFVGEYSGSAEVASYDGGTEQRDMSVSISTTKEGFTVRWSTATLRDSGRKVKSYEISFVPTDRDGVFSAAMTKNVFGHEVPLDPMKGQPYVWARIMGDTLSVFSLFVDNEGGYELQQFDRTLADGGLQLDFERVNDGEKLKSISTFLKKD